MKLLAVRLCERGARIRSGFQIGNIRAGELIDFRISCRRYRRVDDMILACRAVRVEPAQILSVGHSKIRIRNSIGAPSLAAPSYPHGATAIFLTHGGRLIDYVDVKRKRIAKKTFP